LYLLTTNLLLLTVTGKRQTCPLVRESAPHQETRNCLTVIKISSEAPDGCFTPRQTGRLTVGRNITLTLTLTSVAFTRVEAGSNTSTVTLRVVGGDEKESLIFETVKYGHESQRTRTRERLRWRGPAAYTKGSPVMSSKRVSHKNKAVTIKV
jgi:hypothetical protein